MRVCRPTSGQLRWPISLRVAQRCLTASLADGSTHRPVVHPGPGQLRWPSSIEQRCLTASLAIGSTHRPVVHPSRASCAGPHLLSTDALRHLCLPGWGLGWVPPALRTDRSMAYPAVLQRDCPSPGQLRWPSSRRVAQRCLTASLCNGNMLTVGELGLLDRRAAPSSLAAPRTDGEAECAVGVAVLLVAG